MRNWPKSRGRVVGNVAEWSKGQSAQQMGRKTIYFPEIEFDARGIMHRAKSGSGRSRPWPLGEPIELHYNPRNPDHLLDLNLWQRLVFSGAFIVLGALSLAAAMGWID